MSFYQRITEGVNRPVDPNASRFEVLLAAFASDWQVWKGFYNAAKFFEEMEARLQAQQNVIGQLQERIANLEQPPQPPAE